ncbi:hypothetical protein BD560DRAFT_418057 [Blakeslea trispora]|nr:hypothetical protein BD560DRAFT_418057 [Blakeslea trispora]
MLLLHKTFPTFLLKSILSFFRQGLTTNNKIYLQHGLAYGSMIGSNARSDKPKDTSL